MRVEVYNEDCIKGAARIPDNSIDLGVHDPPFGIKEASFAKHYNRDNSRVLPGYVEAPADYQKFSNEWIEQAARTLKKDGTLYIVIGWSRLREVLNAVESNGLIIHNHIVWKYNFGVYTTRKFCSSHYHILRVGKSKNLKFNRLCRFSPDDKNELGRSKLYQDMEDVWVINREYARGEAKNCNKLPNELVNKMILYSSDPGDTVSDFFLGNGTTAHCAVDLHRNVVGFELNSIAYRQIQKWAARRD